MADKLYELLEYVKVNENLYRSSNMTYDVIDGVLHFMLQFNYHVIKEIDTVEKMQKLKVEVNLGEKSKK